MNEMREEGLADYYRAADSWADDRARRDARANRTAWIIAGVASVIALLEAIALVVLTPLKTVEPYTLLVDKQTGAVQALKPLERQTIAPDTALVRSFLVQYVIAREEFDINALQADYRKVALWSAGEARDTYVKAMQAGNPASPLATLPRRALVEVSIRSVSPLGANTALVRFDTLRTDPGGQAQAPQAWAAVIAWRFSGAAMSEADRLTNPLGFQVTRYHRDAEMPPPVAQSSPAPVTAPATVQPRP